MIKKLFLQSWPPVGQMFMSPAFWALLMLQFGSDWGHYFILTGVPKYLNEVRKVYHFPKITHHITMFSNYRFLVSNWPAQEFWRVYPT